jgi:hypothetical protein
LFTIASLKTTTTPRTRTRPVSDRKQPVNERVLIANFLVTETQETHPFALQLAPNSTSATNNTQCAPDTRSIPTTSDPRISTRDRLKAILALDPASPLRIAAACACDGVPFPNLVLWLSREGEWAIIAGLLKARIPLGCATDEKGRNWVHHAAIAKSDQVFTALQAVSELSDVAQLALFAKFGGEQMPLQVALFGEDGDGRTPLHLAAANNHALGVAVLMSAVPELLVIKRGTPEHGWDLIDKHGKSPYDLACENEPANGNSDITKLLVLTRWDFTSAVSLDKPAKLAQLDASTGWIRNGRPVQNEFVRTAHYPGTETREDMSEELILSSIVKNRPDCLLVIMQCIVDRLQQRTPAERVRGRAVAAGGLEDLDYRLQGWLRLAKTTWPEGADLCGLMSEVHQALTRGATHDEFLKLANRLTACAKNATPGLGRAAYDSMAAALLKEIPPPIVSSQRPQNASIYGVGLDLK